jgi:hypothetical protein
MMPYGIKTTGVSAGRRRPSNRPTFLLQTHQYFDCLRVISARHEVLKDAAWNKDHAAPVDGRLIDQAFSYKRTSTF